MRHSSLPTVPFLTALLLCGCGLRGEDLSLEGQAIVTDANEADVTIVLSSGLSALPGFALTGAQMTLNAAVAAQPGVASFAEPAGCMAVATEGNVVTYTFNGCTGPWGLVTLTGQEIATFSPGDGPGKVVVDLRSLNLEADGTPVTHEASVVVTSKNGVQTVDWLGSYVGTTRAGRKVKHASALTLVREENQCVSLKGTTDTKIGLRGLNLKYQGLQRCGARNTCPTGTIVATGDLSRLRVTLTFDGTNEGLATGRNGGEKSFALSCKPKVQP